MNFGLKYDGFVRNDDQNNFTRGHGSLVAKRLSDTIEVGKYNIQINRKGTPLHTDKLHFDNLFASRNYKIEKSRYLLPTLLKKGRKYFIEDEGVILVDHGEGPREYGRNPTAVDPQGPPGERGNRGPRGPQGLPGIQGSLDRKSVV